MKGLLHLTFVLPLAIGCMSSKDAQLFEAVKTGDTKTIGELADDGANLDATNINGLTPLLVAMKENRLSAYEALLEKGADPNKVVLNGISVMNEAAGLDTDNWLRKAISHRGYPDLLNKGNGNSPGATPLFYAIDARATKCAAALIEAKADVNWMTDDDEIPLIEACQGGRFDIVLLLLEAGADYNKKAAGGTLLAQMKDRTEDVCGNDKKQREAFRKVVDWLKNKGAL